LSKINFKIPHRISKFKYEVYDWSEDRSARERASEEISEARAIANAWQEAREGEGEGEGAQNMEN
jgi:hypothetical protein